MEHIISPLIQSHSMYYIICNILEIQELQLYCLAKYNSV